MVMIEMFGVLYYTIFLLYNDVCISLNDFNDILLWASLPTTANLRLSFRYEYFHVFV